MFNDPKGPIEHFSWGKFIVLGEEHSNNDGNRIGKGKDLIIVENRVKHWKNRRSHVLDKSMVEEIFNYKIDTLIIGNGVNGMLTVPTDVKEYLLEKGIAEIIIRTTPEACKLLNSLVHKGVKVGLMAHGTC